MELNTGRFTERDFFIVRMILALTMIFTLVFPQFTAFNVQPEIELIESDSAMGGGMSFDLISFTELIETTDLEFFGVPEPEEFSRPRLYIYDSYRVQSGDTISAIAMNAGLNQDTLLSVNQIRNSRLLQIGQVLKIPNQDGIYYTVKNTDTLSSIAESYNIDTVALRTANELFSDSIDETTRLFIPGGMLDWVLRQEINGDLFIWPVSGIITSPYGYRNSPFGGGRQFHYGIDIRASHGTIIRAAMAGRVTFTGYDRVYGNYVVITHHSGYRTLYAHMSSISTRTGAYVGAGERIGLVGSTGLSTGPHLHFTVYRDGVTVNPRLLMR